MSHLEDADKLRRSIERGDPQPTCAFTGQRMSEPTPSNDGLPAGMELGTVYLFPFRGGSGTLYEFVSAASYHELERENADLRAAAIRELEADAKRYRWLKEQAGTTWDDAAIDAAMKGDSNG